VVALEETKRLRCPYDGYVWTTRSKLKMVTCPSCTRKVDSDTNIVKEEELEEMQHFNLDQDGVRILDKSLATRQSPHGRIIDIYFKKGKAQCDYCDSDDCKHIRYALTLPIVIDILRKKGWKIT
jgi:DNA-directed RNA polymerase subunit RPC12/RpoP